MSPESSLSLQKSSLEDRYIFGASSAFFETRGAFTFDPDTPLPSVERAPLPSDSQQCAPSTPSIENFTEQISDGAIVQEQIDALHSLKLTSPETSELSPERKAPTPSICISPSASPVHVVRSDSLVADLRTLHIDSRDGNSKPPLRTPSSPSPSRRRRSGSGIIRDTHRIEDEPPHPSPFHNPEVQNSLSDVKRCVSRMVTALSSSSLHLESGSTIQSLHQQALDLVHQQLPSSRIVGLIGDSGVGKSSLINSLLDKENLVRASGSGTACTCAVTEYIYHDKDNFIIHVDYFTLDELRRQFEELLRAYRDYEELPETAKSKGGNKEAQSVNKVLEKKANLATQTFSAIFKAKLGNEPTVLSTMVFERAINLMVGWAEDLLPRTNDQESFNTDEQCSSRLRELTSESDARATNGATQNQWPLIRKLRVHLNAYILSKGLIVADLPGLRDHNSARRAITERYVRQCHQIFAVARIDRAVTDESVEEIFELARHAKLSKIDVVCTRSEDIQIREAKHDWIAERARIEELESAIEADTQEVDSLKEDIQDFEQDLKDLTREERHEFEQLQQDCRKAEQSKQKHEFEMLRLIVTLRNAKVSDGLRAYYKDHPVASTLRIFCVSNKIYWDHRSKPAPKSAPYLKMSGIIQLRQHCIGIVADSRLRAAVSFIKDQVPAFLVSVGLWVEAGSGNSNAEKKQQMLDAWHHSSFRAFCSNYGDHCTPTIGRRCWNKEAMAQMKSDMIDIWSDFAADNDDHLQDSLDKLGEDFEDVVSVDRSELGIKSRSVARVLHGILDHRKDLVLYGIEDAIEEYRRGLRYLETDALAPVRTSFMGKLMEDTYHAANMEYGTGSDQRRKRLIKGGFGDRDLMETYRRACKAGFKALARSLQEQISEVVGQQIQLIEADLQILNSENVVLESERNPQFRRRVGSELDFVRKELERAQRIVTTAT
ncbi:hypothetical protein C7974DRAFT_301862 [Boeremia exigua]|uniref:uncharacterized protein n=1 Tax=Boeremia exigua TaxID=749465 RepID=UPI001E8EC923|nr:uncharacterized protein C7974DRAFT_301862 [Boeremia exigua]KAH6642927.1 hypothetical protein C7974DRAFT_301862 [Boeremia exigua]